MGCDIHLHIEVKVNGKWEHYAAPSIDRDYRLFATMADVRNEDHRYVPISKPKGFPEDASILTRLLREDYEIDGHSDSWLDHNEVMILEDRLKSFFEEDRKENPRLFSLDYCLEHSILHTYLGENSFTAHWRYDDIPYLPKGITDFRFVFWFDN